MFSKGKCGEMLFLLATWQNPLFWNTTYVRWGNYRREQVSKTSAAVIPHFLLAHVCSFHISLWITWWHTRVMAVAAVKRMLTTEDGKRIRRKHQRVVPPPPPSPPPLSCMKQKTHESAKKREKVEAPSKVYSVASYCCYNETHHGEKSKVENSSAAKCTQSTLQ